jgi:lipopolysaccharide/colanic/teichoic acid biosynthesis glycosyltransferase
MAIQLPRRQAIHVEDRSASDHWLRLLTRNRYQLIGAALFAISLPAAVRKGFDLGLPTLGSMENTIAGTFAAMLLGTYLLRRLTAYPGVSTVSTLLPAFTASYGLAVLLFFFLRLDYSRFQFLASFVLVLIWFAFVGIVEQRTRRPRLLLLPFGRSESLLGEPQVDWTLARSAEELPPAVTGVVADFRANLGPEWERLLAGAALAGLPVYHWKQIAESLSGTVEIEHLSENNFGSLLPSSIYLRFKHIVDFTAALIVAPFALLVALPAVVAIWLEDGGPIIFRQQRMGFRGRPFTILKFRTMRTEANEPGSAFTLANDSRITRVGAALRHYRIDEIPQIINILRGEMSWIGPRPEALQLSAWYESQIPFYSYRHIVRPGITGWAQVNQGNVAEINAATGKLHYDFYYIKYVSPWLDLLIVARTMATIATGFGAR